jgi:hypothetical protein
MQLSFSRVARPRWLATLMALTVLSMGQWAGAQTIGIVKVEEDWELVVKEPDVSVCAPQITSVISPVGHLDGVYAAFELNYENTPEFVAGGMQVQVWNGETPVVTRRSREGERLGTNNETITWTQVMRLDNGSLSFWLKDGVSTTWGTFGGWNDTSVSVSTALTSLHTYNPLVSVEGSGVGFAGNRVTSLRLLRVRYHTSTGQVIEDNTVRVAFPTN